MKKAWIRAGKGLLASTAIATALVIAPASNAASEQEAFVQLMSQYLELGNAVVDTAERPEAAIFLAIEGIFEVYEQRRDAPNAVQHFERMLEDYGENQTVRNLIRFKLRDIYKETGQTDKALEQLELIVAENARL
jgi:predicted negative regulator of RcsB-dependent stress response